MPRPSEQLDSLTNQARAAAGGFAQGEDALAAVLRELERDSTNARLQLELRALLGLAAAVSAVHGLDDVIETAAEEARAALGAGSLSIGRLELESQALRVLINVGDLAPGEERRPSDEIYAVADYPRLLQMVEQMEPHTTSIDDLEADAAELDLLRSLGKSSEVAVPIVFADRMWGELYATRAAGDAPFGDRDVRFLQAIAGQLAAALGRAEMFSRLAELAFEDSLTGLANRRALDERLEAEVAAALAEERDLALVLCDVDNLKEINDGAGHQAGDAALVRVAHVLSTVVGDGAGSMVARLGGDEFCLLLPGASSADARATLERALGVLEDDGPAAVGISAGIASIGSGARRPADLMRAADAALYTAKRNGRQRVFVARSEDASAERPVPERRSQLDPRKAADFHRLVTDTIAELDAMTMPALERLTAAVVRIASVAGAPAWAVSHSEPGSGQVRTVHWMDTRWHQGAVWADIVDEIYELDQYPRTAAIMESGGSFVTRADDPDADPGELGVLAEGELATAIVAAAPSPSGTWLVEVYGDETTLDPELVEPYVRLLAAEAVRGATMPPPSDEGRRAARVDGVTS
jgi:diguanylate cyclase (GGDEF)-like protein